MQCKAVTFLVNEKAVRKEDLGSLSKTTTAQKKSNFAFYFHINANFFLGPIQLP